MRSNKRPRPYHRWRASEFGLLLPGYYFKASKTNQTWWIKVDSETARSENGKLRQRWYDHDLVWVDISNSLYRVHMIGTGDANDGAKRT